MLCVLGLQTCVIYPQKVKNAPPKIRFFPDFVFYSKKSHSKEGLHSISYPRFAYCVELCKVLTKENTSLKPAPEGQRMFIASGGTLGPLQIEQIRNEMPGEVFVAFQFYLE